MAVDVATSGELNTSSPDDEEAVAEIPAAQANTPADTADAESADEAVDETDVGGVTTGEKPRRWTSELRWALVAGLVAVLALGGLAGWLGVQAHRTEQAKQTNELYLQVARQGALNLTTIDFQEADTDIQRILDSATGEFYEEFAQRSAPFVEVVKQTQSKTVGTVTEAGLESVDGDKAQAIVAVNVTTSSNAPGANNAPGPNGAAAPQEPRIWRMRLTMQRVGQDVKISNVSFVQ
ncbi:MAG: Mce-associated rane protein [Mycobacterium sp.]|nr:Mce-associated rane protein [Mycobacterium sp.]